MDDSSLFSIRYCFEINNNIKIFMEINLVWIRLLDGETGEVFVGGIKFNPASVKLAKVTLTIMHHDISELTAVGNVQMLS